MILTYVKRFLVTEDFFECNLKLLFLCGLWPGKNLTRHQLKLYKIYENTLNMFMIIFLIITGISTLRCTDVYKLISNIDKSIISYNFFFRVICFTFRRDEIELLINDIIISGDKVTDRARDKMIKLAVGLSLQNTFSGFVFCLIGFVNYELAIDLWLPFDISKSRKNLIIGVQIVVVLYLVPFLMRGVAMQGIVCSLMIYLCEQLEDLQKRIRGLKYTKENEKPMRDELKKIIRKHIRLVRYANSMKNMFSEYFLVQNLCFTLELCVNAVLIATVNLHEMYAILGFLTYLSTALMNEYIYCSLGDDLILQSVDVAQAAYDSEWTSWPEDLQKTVLLIITVAQRPLQMTAGGFVPMNINTFGNALYNGYTVYAVLSDVVNLEDP